MIWNEFTSPEQAILLLLSTADVSSNDAHAKLLANGKEFSLQSIKSAYSRLLFQERIHICKWGRMEYTSGKHIKSCAMAIYRMGKGVNAIRPEKPSKNARVKKEDRGLMPRRSGARPRIQRDYLQAAFFGPSN